MSRLIVLMALLPLVVFGQIDLSGEWNPVFHEDQPERIPGPEIGDYLGLPITDAARMRGDSWDAEILTLPEHQCKPHPADYGPRGPFNVRIWKEVDTATQQIIAWHTHGSWQAPERTIYMDGRPHPPEYAAHTWQGFSTGKWDGDILTITTDAPQDRLDPAERDPAQRPRDPDRALDPARRPADLGQHRERSGVSDRAVHPLDGFRIGSAPADRSVSVRVRDRGCAAERRGAEFSAGDESVSERVRDAPLDTGEGCPRRSGHHVSRRRSARSGEPADPGAELHG